mmetsp:Transcript_51106/g.76582  ORF Transcript_51106/g.76582 Transcript_51106/m.76582 type:complete len:83 (-) Transcript_51106:149-397(-)
MAEDKKPARGGNWKLPDGIEDHIESGLIKAAIGGVVGGVVGLALFRSGKGMRMASVAGGVGAAVGSTVERAMFELGDSKSSI